MSFQGEKCDIAALIKASHEPEVLEYMAKCEMCNNDSPNSRVRITTVKSIGECVIVQLLRFQCDRLTGMPKKVFTPVAINEEIAVRLSPCSEGMSHFLFVISTNCSPNVSAPAFRNKNLQTERCDPPCWSDNELRALHIRGEAWNTMGEVQ